MARTLSTALDLIAPAADLFGLDLPALKAGARRLGGLLSRWWDRAREAALGQLERALLCVADVAVAVAAR